jgi:drug/metabolite transporter (DMT)-like permease
MDLLKLGIEWAKAEIFSAKIMWLFSIITLLSAAGFSFWGKTPMAKAFVIPLILAGIFLVSVGIGLYAANYPRIAQFEKDYQIDAKAFITKEIARTADSQGQLKLVFRILPAIAIVAAILLMIFPSPPWRAITVTMILLSAFLMTVDSNTEARNDAYHEQLIKHLAE